MLKANRELTESSAHPHRWKPIPALGLFDRHVWWSTLLVLAAIAVLVRLGFWQLARLEQRRTRNAQIAHQLALPPVALTPGLSLPGNLAQLKNRRVVAQGEFDFSQQVALLYQNRQGAPGLHLIAPLVLADGSAAVLVDRGWIPQAAAAPDQWPQFDEPGPAPITGFIQLSQTLPAAEEPRTPHTPRIEWYRVDIPAIQAQLPYKLLPVYILQSAAGQNSDDLPYRIEPEFDLSDGPHLGYAGQWFLFALILGVGYVYYLVKAARAMVGKPREER
ncbi:MAG: SURF1 family protein [Anaerolineales bacterium]|nr:SURF1 family protein [Anaerolineales bacterium]